MRLHESQKGSALIEFVFVLPVLVIMALGVFDFSHAITQGMAVQAAAHVGTEFASAEGNFYNTTQMQTYAVQSAPGIVGLTAVGSNFCTCTAGGSVVNCASFCNGNELPMQYAQTQTSAAPSILFRYAGFPIAFNLAGNSVRRIR